MIQKIKNYIYEETIFYFSRIGRLSLSRNYIQGCGIEIGAMDLPLRVKKGVKVKYLDRIPKDEQVKIFKNLDVKKLVDIDIIGNGETLEGIENNCQDFLIANHFIEHCQNPVSTFENMLRVIKPTGVIFMAIPDKRFTFDIDRQITPLEHFIIDYTDSPQWSEQDHYYDFVKHTTHGVGKSDDEINEVINSLKARNFSIHFHVWDHQSMIDFFCMLKQKLGFTFEIEVAIAARAYSNESIFILKKNK